MRYIDMTEDERRAAFEVLEGRVDAQTFGANGAERGAKFRVDKWRNEQAFIARCAKKMGDSWANGVSI